MMVSPTRKRENSDIPRLRVGLTSLDLRIGFRVRFRFDRKDAAMPGLLKRMAQRLPAGWRNELKRHYYAWQIRRGQFRTTEQEYGLLDQFIGAGDWVLDVGANVGHYTAKLSKLVGPVGRVIAFEPVPATFRLLAENARLFPYANVTLLNAAASETSGVAGMELPAGSDGPYLAHVTPHGALKVLCLAIDSLHLPHRVSLAKIDAEGHELAVLRGMIGVIDRDRPTLIVEVSCDATRDFLMLRGYSMKKLAASPNCIFRA